MPPEFRGHYVSIINYFLFLAATAAVPAIARAAIAKPTPASPVSAEVSAVVELLEEDLLELELEFEGEEEELPELVEEDDDELSELESELESESESEEDDDESELLSLLLSSEDDDDESESLSLLVSSDVTFEVPVAPVPEIVNTTLMLDSISQSSTSFVPVPAQSSRR